MFLTATVVPTALGTTERDRMRPMGSNSSLVAASWSAVRVTTDTSATLHNEDSASPRNP